MQNTCFGRFFTCPVLVYDPAFLVEKQRNFTDQLKSNENKQRSLYMAHISGVNIPDNKRVIISLTYVHGIGRFIAERICREVGIDFPSREGFNRGRAKPDPQSD